MECKKITYVTKLLLFINNHTTWLISYIAKIKVIYYYLWHLCIINCIFFALIFLYYVLKSNNIVIVNTIVKIL